MCCRALASVSAAITLPSADRDWLIFFDSSRRRPVAPVSRTRSEPARSTRFSLPTLNACPLYPLSPSAPGSCAPVSSSMYSSCSEMMMKTACDRDDISFIFVDAVARVMAPRCIRP